MRQIAGTLRLNLAQFRELAAFAQFGSDLDKATLAQLARGQRMVELLKQGQYVPLTVEKQIAIIFAGAQGLLDDIAVEQIRAFEEFFLPWMERRNAQLLAEIANKRELTDDLRSALTKAVNDGKAEFMRQHPLTGAQILAPLEFFADGMLIVRHHHERFDGSGYPDGLRGPAIPLGARIVAVVDVYDALTSDRAYRPALAPPVVIDRLRREAGRTLDGDLVALFVDLPNHGPADRAV